MDCHIDSHGETAYRGKDGVRPENLSQVLSRHSDNHVQHDILLIGSRIGNRVCKG